MMIKFICPNGHELSATLDRAGKPGNCPKCGTEFIVPDEEGDREGSEEIPATMSKQGMIEFLCPNGHRLNGPAWLQGRPGQCPHCGEKFRIPDYREEEPEEGSEVPGVATPDDSRVGKDEIREVVDKIPVSSNPVDSFPVTEEAASEAVDIVNDSDEIDRANRIGSPLMDPIVSAGGGLGMAGHFARFWDQKTDQNEVRLHLRDGQVIVPQFFANQISDESCGVFAIQKDDGTYTVSAISWDAIHRLSMTKVKQLPQDFFD